MAIEAAQFFLGDELRGAPADVGGVFPSHVLRTGGDQIGDKQPAFAHEAGIFALRRQFRIGFGFLRFRQPLHRAIQARDPQIAIHRHQQALAVRRPGVIGDALHIGDALAFAIHPLRFGQRPAGQPGRIDQHAPRAGGGIHRPQIEARAIVGPVLQQGGQPAIGRQFQHARPRAGQRGRCKHALKRERCRLLGQDGSVRRHQRHHSCSPPQARMHDIASQIPIPCLRQWRTLAAPPSAC